MSGPVELQHVTVEEAMQLSAGASVLVDVREQWEWDAGHAPNAILLPTSQLLARLEELPKDSTLLLVCHSGQRSLDAARFLCDAGYDAINVLGGMSAWQRAGGPLVTEQSADSLGSDQLSAERSEPPHA